MNRICKDCKVEKAIDLYEKSGKGDTRRLICRACRKIKNKERISKIIEEDNEDNNILLENRICKDCKIEKNIDLFEKTGNGNARRLSCKACRKIKKNEVILKTREEKNILPEDVPKPNFCIRCNKSQDEVDFKWRTDTVSCGWRNVCNSCYNEKKYHKVYIEKKRAEDEDAFLKHNNEIHSIWKKNNPENIIKYKLKIKCDPDQKMKQIRQSVKSEFNDDDFEVMKLKLSEPCYYCNFKINDGDILNGLDRIVPENGYTNNNTVSCCVTCNCMKLNFNSDVFITKVRRIFAYRNIEVNNDIKRYRLKPYTKRRVLEGLKEKEKIDLLTDIEKINLWASSCYLCGVSPCFGIDRIDSEENYTISNSKPCCMMCNYMKKNLALNEFEKHIGFIKNHTNNWDIPDVSDIPILPPVSKEKRPIAITDLSDKIIIIFPSANKIDTMTIFTNNEILKNIENNINLTKIYKLKYVSNSEYNNQNIDYESAYKILMLLNKKK
jgi:hypothetical protein